jgi:hypothetical protein
VASSEICVAQPVYFVVWVRRLRKDDANAICRLYPSNDSLVRSGEHYLTASFGNGMHCPTSIAIPQEAVLRAPGEDDARMELFDRVMRTWFAEIDCPCSMNVQTPFFVSSEIKTLSTYCGIFTLNYLDFCSDPGFARALEEADECEWLIGRSGKESLLTDARDCCFEAGDVIPVVVNAVSGRVFGVLELTAEQLDGEFAVKLTTPSALDNEQTSYEIRRELCVQALDPTTGDVVVKSYSRLFGTIRVDR